MKVLLINGSPKKEGNTFTALDEMRKIFVKEGVEAEIVTVGGLDIRGCAACGYCHKNGKCVFNDIVNELAEKFKEADGLVVGSPVYYASANGTLVSFLDRLFYSSSFDKSFKVGASVAVARRGGCSSTFDELNKYFTISGMPVASSAYWNSVHGRSKRRFGRLAYYARFSAQHGLFNEVNRAWQRAFRLARAGRTRFHKLYKIKNSEGKSDTLVFHVF